MKEGYRVQSQQVSTTIYIYIYNPNRLLRDDNEYNWVWWNLLFLCVVVWVLLDILLLCSSIVLWCCAIVVVKVMKMQCIKVMLLLLPKLYRLN